MRFYSSPVVGKIISFPGNAALGKTNYNVIKRQQPR